MLDEKKTVYSIHRNCVKTGKPAPTVYNSCPEEPKSPTTARGKRRLANKLNKAK